MPRPSRLVAVITTVTLIAIGAIAVARPTGASVFGPPSALVELPLSEALARNVIDGRIVIVKCTSTRCGVSPGMERTTWLDESLVEWTRDRGTAIRLDIDRDREDARRLRIVETPTLIVFRGGKEVDRKVGSRRAEYLLAWFTAIEGGETAESRFATALAAPREGDGAMTMQERLGLARALARSGLFAAAVDEHVWLWTNMVRVDASMARTRLSSMADEMRRLSSVDPVALAQFTALRDVSAHRMQQDGSVAALSEWLVLNDVVLDPNATLDWFDRVKDRPEEAERLRAVERRIVALLRRHNRWADIGRLEHAPLAKLEREARAAQRLASRRVPAGQARNAEESALQRDHQYEWAAYHLREVAGPLYGSLLAAGRHEDAAEVADAAIRLEIEDPESMAHQLLAYAIEVGAVTEVHRSLAAERPLPAAVRARYGDILPDRLSDEYRAARRADAIAAIEEALLNTPQAERPTASVDPNPTG